VNLKPHSPERQHVIESALHFLLKDRVRHGDVDAERKASDHLSALNTRMALEDPPEITSAASATGTAGYAFKYQIVASNEPASYSASGLPDGLTLDEKTGAISGVPVKKGTASVELGATNSNGTGNRQVIVTVAANPNAPPEPPVEPPVQPGPDRTLLDHDIHRFADDGAAHPE